MLPSDLVLANLKPSPTNSIQIIALHSYACCYCDKTPTHANNSRHIMQDVINITKSYSLYYLIEMIKTLL